MKRYLHILIIFYKAAILADLEYRTNFIVNLLLSLVSVSWSVAGVAVFFLHTDEIRGWDFYGLMVVLGLFLFFLGLVDVFLAPNVRDLIEHIRLGTMDFILTKPINAQFHASLRRINIWRLTDVLLGLGIVVYSVNQSALQPTAPTILLFIALCLCAVVIMYALVMLLITSAFWFVQVDNVMELLFTFYEAGRFPVTIFPAWIRAVLTFVVPVAFVTTVPAAILLGRMSWLFGLYSLAATVLLFSLSALFWRYAVRHYSSASS